MIYLSNISSTLQNLMNFEETLSINYQIRPTWIFARPGEPGHWTISL